MNCLVFGRRRMGKSTLSLMLAHACYFAINQSRDYCIIIFDPNMQYPSVPLVPIDSLPVILDASGQKGTYTCVRVSTEGSESVESSFDRMVAILWEYDEYSLVIDESSMLQSSGWTHPTLDKLIRQCPSGVSIIQSTHRPVDTSRLVRSLVTDIWFFATTNQTDLNLIEKEYGPAIAGLIPTLRQHACIHYWIDKGGDTRMSVWERPEIWRIDLENGNEIR